MNTRRKLWSQSLLCLGIILGTQACKSGAPLVFEAKELNRGYENCAPASQNCTYLRLNYPEFTSGQAQPALQAINQGIRQFVLAPASEGPTLAKPEALADQFFSDFKKFEKDFPQAPQQWSLERKVEILLNEPKILSLEMEQADYLGGAHPNASAQFVSLDPSTGKRYALGDFFKPGTEAALQAFAEKSFRQSRQIPAGQSLEEAGFEFKGGKFQLNDNFAAGASGLIFYFNPYEIGAYVMGPTELKLPYPDLKPWIREEGPLRNWDKWK